MPATIQRIQTLRAAAALSVVLAHAIGDYKAFAGIDLLPLHYLGAAGVDLFFVISGLVMVQSTGRSFGERHAAAVFLTRRWFRIAPLYWIVMAAYAVLQIAQGKWHVIDGPRIITSALFFPMRSADGSIAPFYGIGWTLNYEMLFYVVFASWLGFRRGLALACIAATIGIAVMIGLIIPLMQPLQFWFNAIILEFLLGILIAVAFERGWAISPRFALAAIGLAIAALIGGGALGFNAVLPDVPTAFPRWIAWGVPAATIVAAVTLCRDKTFERPSRLGPALGHTLGDASYSMYLLHPFVIILLRTMIPFTTPTPDAAVVLRVLAGTGHVATVVLLTALLSLASFALLERPIIRLGKTVASLLQWPTSADHEMPRLKADI